jgi:signal transduction histidine kinase
VVVLLILQWMSIGFLLGNRILLRRAKQDQTKLAERLLRTQDEERAHLARELHDTLGQELTLLAIEMDREAVSAPEQGRFAERLRRAIGHTQHLANSLMPSAILTQDLVTAVSQYAESLGRRMGLRVEVSAERWPHQLDPDRGLNIYRIVQESLHNIVKHASATMCSVRLEGSPHELLVSITDDGVGFETGAHKSGRLGLLGMRQRAQRVRGQLRMESRPLQGSTITLTIPLGES